MNRRAFLTVALVSLAGCRSETAGLDAFGTVPDFALTDQTGQRFAGKSMRGKVWVANFMFTNCMGPCPRMASRLHQIQQETAALAGVEIVSFTIDPANDTPVVLAAYAKQHAASPERWHFLTGPQSALHQLSRNVFKLGDVDGTLTHSTRFVLVDRAMEIRRSYDSFDPDDMKKLATDIGALSRERKH